MAQYALFQRLNNLGDFYPCGVLFCAPLRQKDTFAKKMPTKNGNRLTINCRLLSHQELNVMLRDVAHCCRHADNQQ
jgi:hypothetical protein